MNKSTNKDTSYYLFDNGSIFFNDSHGDGYYLKEENRIILPEKHTHEKSKVNVYFNYF
jgi:hypothetical protein